jgi:threonine dehydrogenase-like Zn-dependent dehydrogenase
VEAVRKLTDGRGADVIVVAAASATAQEDALRMAARRGEAMKVTVEPTGAAAYSGVT